MTPEQRTKTPHYYWQGFRAGAPFILVVAPFGLLFGVIATEAGMDIVQTMAMTVLVIAGAAQFAAVQLLVENAPVYVAILTGLAVNMRMAMYSASMAPHIGSMAGWKRIIAAYFLVDQSYAASIRQYEDAPEMQPSEKLVFFFGTISPICFPWYFFTYIGAKVGAAIPPEYALDFAVPITFIALVAPSLRSLPHLAAAFISVVVSLSLAWLPYNLWLMIAAVLAMMTGAYIEKRTGIAP
jgi:4-azaleucine resistance transporter AzlC